MSQEPVQGRNAVMQPEQVSPGLWMNCPVCGHRNAEAESRCEKCGRRLPPRQGRDEGSPLGPTAIPALPLTTTAARRDTGSSSRGPALPPHLRRQLSARIEEFRARRLNPTLPFVPVEEEATESKVVPIRVEPQHRETRKPAEKSRRSLAPVNQQPALEFLSPIAPSEPVSIPVVAPFRLRMAACGLDLALILAAGLVFFLFLKLMAGSIPVDRFLLGGGLCATVLLALLYGGTFLYGSGVTPGMRWLGLRLVNFDGKPALHGQRLGRLAGTIVSAGSFFLGYLWAAFDEESLFWHDRISRTFLTAEDESSTAPPASGLKSHKCA
ncbi:MAG: RDD family protein [Acidobacteria bacterium]|nr:RDD family protein [Acidobacteriota bacterium]